GKSIIGWKLAQTTPKAQALAGLAAPTVSPLLDGMIVPNETVFPTKHFYAPEVEAEIVIETALEIDGPLTAAATWDAVGNIRLAMEIADTRYVDKPAVGALSVIADMNSCGALVVGPPLNRSELMEAAACPVLLRLGDSSLLTELEPDMRPKPLEVLRFLSEFATARGHKIPAGTLVTTGTHTKPTHSGPGQLVAEFRSAGKLFARLSEARS
ncbi:MAG: fumarylacetoacetate hydrolase family protein, partial [Pseudomonadota bacterium]